VLLRRIIHWQFSIALPVIAIMTGYSFDEAETRRELNAEDYGRHLRGMWLAQNIAN
jgi:hypothetical protein